MEENDKGTHVLTHIGWVCRHGYKADAPFKACPCDPKDYPQAAGDESPDESPPADERPMLSDVYAAVAAERVRAHALHGDSSMERLATNDPTRLSILLEEVGEVGRELNEGRLSPGGIDRGRLWCELVQVAAMAVAWADAIGIETRNRGRTGFGAWRHVRDNVRGFMPGGPPPPRTLVGVYTKDGLLAVGYHVPSDGEKDADALTFQIAEGSRVAIPRGIARASWWYPIDLPAEVLSRGT